jgi:heme A synthase
MNPRLHRCALFVVILAVAALLSGAFITSTEVSARLSQSAATGIAFSDNLHRAVAIALTLLILTIAIWTSLGATARWLRVLAWTGVAALVLDAVLGWHVPPLAASVGVWHALVSHAFLAIAVAMAFGTSAGWNRDPEIVDGSARPLLRPLAVATPPVVFLQIALGAAYRHDMTSLMPHMAVAMGVVFFALIGSSVILQNFPRPASLRRAAATLISILILQVCLGIAAFLMLVLNAAGSGYFVITTVGHLLVGSATLSASIVLAMQVCRSVRTRRTPKVD